MPDDVLIIGGGLTGLSCAITLAGHGFNIRLIEAAPQLGGRTASFFERHVHEWVDHGPHLLIGAYHQTRRFLDHCDAGQLTDWQHSLELPLWDSARGMFSLAPDRAWPLPLALLRHLPALPGHDWRSAAGILRLALRPPHDNEHVAAWLQRLRIPGELRRDLLEPLCLGAMNEPLQQAHAGSFQRVLKQSFSGHAQARLGWFNQPLSSGLIARLEHKARQCGVHIHTGMPACRIHPHHDHLRIESRGGRRFTARRVVMAIAPWHQRRLTGQAVNVASNPITNIHLWFRQPVRLPHPFIGGIGTRGQWFFDISAQMRDAPEYTHLCVVISAFRPDNHADILQQVCRELEQIIPQYAPLKPCHTRIVCEQRATALVRPGQQADTLPAGIINAMEYPRPGGLPATIEFAIERGIKTANMLRMSSF